MNFIIYQCRYFIISRQHAHIGARATGVDASDFSDVGSAMSIKINVSMIVNTNATVKNSFKIRVASSINDFSLSVDRHERLLSVFTINDIFRCWINLGVFRIATQLRLYDFANFGCKQKKIFVKKFVGCAFCQLIQLYNMTTHILKKTFFI